MIPTAEQLIAMQQSAKTCADPACGKPFVPDEADDSLAKRVLAELRQGPGTVDEIRLEIGHCNSKTLGMTVKRLCDKGLVVRLYLIPAGKNGGPRPWCFGLAGVDYGLIESKGSIKSRILALLANGGATRDDLAEELKHPVNAVGIAIAELRRDGKIKRAGRLPGINPRSGPQPWIYELGVDSTRNHQAEPKRAPDPARIAGPIYMRQFATWGARI